MATYTAIASKCVFTATIGAGSQATLIDVCRHFTINTDIISMSRCVWISKENQCFITVFSHSYTINILDHGDPRGQKTWRRDPRVEAELDRGIRNHQNTLQPTGETKGAAEEKNIWNILLKCVYLCRSGWAVCNRADRRRSGTIPDCWYTPDQDTAGGLHTHSRLKRTHSYYVNPLMNTEMRWDEMRWQIRGSHHESPFAKFIKAPFTHALIWAHSENQIRISPHLSVHTWGSFGVRTKEPAGLNLDQQSRHCVQTYR